jgi:tRNA (uracil-5-)-methyltransferase
MNKLCWQGLDKWISDKKLAKTIKKIIPEVQGIILSRPNKKSYAFLEFPDLETMNSFMQKVQDSTDKKKLKFKQAADNLMIKGKTIEELLVPRESRITQTAEELGPIRDKVTPLWNVPYASQLLQKKTVVQNEYNKFLRDLSVRIKKDKSFSPDWLLNPPHVLEVKESPSTECYRNKTEFNIGFYSADEVKVGFTNGKMAAGNLKIESPATCTTLTQDAIVFAERLEKIVKTSGINVFDTKTNLGIWKQAVFRSSSRSGETMASVYVNEYEDIPKIEALLSELCPYYTTVALIVIPDKVKILSGPGFISETILNKKYRISPLSFFQVNTLGYEVLYEEVVKLVNGDVLLDICCGTGTIGISCAEKVKKIIGIEIIPEAVEDAKANAALNGVNAQYHAGKAEDLIKEITKELQGENIFGVVDPPRSGLHKSILHALRTAKGLNHLVYVSCNPSTLFTNLLELCCPEANKLRGPAFVPVSIQPVDMFPQTIHIESVVYLKRSTIL